MWKNITLLIVAMASSIFYRRRPSCKRWLRKLCKSMYKSIGFLSTTLVYVSKKSEILQVMRQRWADLDAWPCISFDLRIPAFARRVVGSVSPLISALGPLGGASVVVCFHTNLTPEPLKPKMQTMCCTQMRPLQSVSMSPYRVRGQVQRECWWCEVFDCLCEVELDSIVVTSWRMLIRRDLLLRRQATRLLAVYSSSDGLHIASYS